MKKYYSIKDVKEALGNLEFLSYEGQEKETKGQGRNAHAVVIGHRYALLSDKQNDVPVVVRGTSKTVDFMYMQKVELVNPKLTAVPTSMNRNRAYVEWEVICDGIKAI